MASPPVSSDPAAERHYSAQDALGVLFLRELADLLRRLFDPADAAASLAAFKASAAALTVQRGTAAAYLANQTYLAARAHANAAGSFRPTQIPPLDAKRIEPVVGAMTTDLWLPQGTDAAFSDAIANDVSAGVGGALEQRVLSQGRDQSLANVARDRAARGFTRLPKPGACAFCMLLSTRDALYKSRETAGEVGASEVFGADALRTLNRYHEGCRCAVVPVFGAYELPEHVAAAKALYERVAQGGDKLNAFRRAYERGEESAGRRPRQPVSVSAARGGFDSLSLDQIRRQIAVVEPLKASGWRDRQLTRLRAREHDLAA